VFKQVRTGVLKATSNIQTPWESSSLIGDFYFVPRGTASPPVAEETTRPQVQDAPPVVVSTRTTSTGPDPEVVMWSLIEQSSNPEDIQEFLRVYPDGRLAPAAHLKLKQLLRQQPKNTEVAVREVPREETKVDAGVVSSKAPEVAARVSPPEGTKMAVEASPLKESAAAVEASPPKEPAVAVGAPPPEEMKVAVKVSPPTQPDSNREEIFRELLNFGALDQAKLQMGLFALPRIPSERVMACER
jgi:hypothetical protein